MQAYRVQTTVAKDGILIIKELPFRAGDKVEVIVLSQEQERNQGKSYPLRGQPIRYDDPFASVAENDWTILQ
jgi:hypothetical protein